MVIKRGPTGGKKDKFVGGLASTGRNRVLALVSKPEGLDDIRQGFGGGAGKKSGFTWKSN